jgi:hypothetical protein
MLQLAMVLKLDRRVPAFTLLDDVVNTGQTGRLLMCTMLLSVLLWVFFSAALFLLEKDTPEMTGAFSDMGISLFTTMIFIGGEWCRIDLSQPFGELIGALLAFVGIGLIGIPMAAFFDAYSEFSEEYFEGFKGTPASSVRGTKDKPGTATMGGGGLEEGEPQGGCQGAFCPTHADFEDNPSC